MIKHLHTFKNFPIFMGCTNQDLGLDKFMDMEWIIEKDGFVHIANLPPQEDVYMEQHCLPIGNMWNSLYQTLLKILDKYNITKVLEIGGGSLELAHRGVKDYWHVVEPHPGLVKSQKIKIYNEWFDENFKTNTTFDAIVHCHVMEHIINPQNFITSLTKLPIKYHIFVVPRLEVYAQQVWFNGLNFEHHYLLTHDLIEKYILENNMILEDIDFQETNAFYVIKHSNHTQKVTTNSYEKNLELFMGFINGAKSLIVNLNRQIKQVKKPVYIFGAHIFAQYLLNLGLDTTNIVGILDNNKLLKQGKRLYGTPYTCYDPQIIKGLDCSVVLHAANYQDEIKQQLLKINPGVNIIERNNNN